MFAYASGSGQVPAAVSISTNGTQLAYVENLPPTAYFHVLTLGTTGTNGASPTAAVAPGSAGGNNAVDRRVLRPSPIPRLSPPARGPSSCLSGIAEFEGCSESTLLGTQ